ncbi:hypothetical protein D9757_005693 [Collybiopsis confluens]|uniref:Uncharacterized protein n=1 Tax=Collybiopsis confluens TaxID=2823264 RepID=A0A8H5FPQ7_9AGAR|nr:hypothetical protein D9757_014998 [Collybiopsis confluens]KAF5388810.1 hypothetical protein D9757_005693 [Collybiopsis confluens]
MWLTDGQKIGVALTTFGALFMLLGVMLFFDGALLALGNILFISGLTLIIGPRKTFYFFARKEKLRGTICFLGGILLVFIKWPFIGMIVETFGFLNLFGHHIYAAASFYWDSTVTPWNSYSKLFVLLPESTYQPSPPVCRQNRRITNLCCMMENSYAFTASRSDVDASSPDPS